MKLARVAMADPTFAEIVAKPSTVLPVVGRVLNYNELVGHDGYIGIKTGSDSAAGGCLLFAKEMTVGGHTFTVLGAIFGQHDGELVSAALAGADELAGSVADAVRTRVAIPKGTTVMRLENADGDVVPVKTGRALKEIGWPGMRTPVHLGVGPARRSASAARTLGHGDGARDDGRPGPRRHRRIARRTVARLAPAAPAVGAARARPLPGARRSLLGRFASTGVGAPPERARPSGRAPGRLSPRASL